MKTKSLLTKRFLVALVAFGLLGVSACSEDDDGDNAAADADADTDTDTDTDADGDNDAFIRVIHLSFDAPAVDIYANGGLAVEDLAYQAGTDYLTVPAGSYDFAVTAAGGNIGDAVLEIDGLDLTAGKYYTAVAFGELAKIQPLALVDDWADLAEGNIRVRAIHTAAGVGQVDIWNITDGQTPGILWENVNFGMAGAYFDLPAGAYSIGFDVDNDATPDLTFDLPALEAGAVANVFAVLDEAVYLLAHLEDGTTLPIESTP